MVIFILFAVMLSVTTLMLSERLFVKSIDKATLIITSGLFLALLFKVLKVLGVV